MQSFFIFGQILDKKNCILDEAPKSFTEKGWRVRKGIEMGDRHPPDVVIKMFNRHPGITVPDVVKNTLGLCIASKRLKEFLVQESGARIECLQISIANHKDRVVSNDYFLINVLDHCDCIDLSKSDVDKNDRKPFIDGGLPGRPQDRLDTRRT